MLEQYEFTTFDGHAESKALRKRAEQMVGLYGKCFPGRPRDAELTDDEILQLLDEVGDGQW